MSIEIRQKQLPNGCFAWTALVLAQDLAKFRKQDAISPLDLFWACLHVINQFIDPCGNESKILLPWENGLENALLAKHPSIESFPKSRARKVLCDDRVSLAVMRAGNLHRVYQFHEEAPLGPAELLASVLTLGNIEVSDEATSMQIEPEVVFSSWPLGEIYKYETPPFQLGAALQSGMLKAGLHEHGIEAVALKAKEDFAFGLAYLTSIYYGVSTGEKMHTELRVNPYLSMLLGEAFFLPRINLFSYGSVEEGELIELLKWRSVSPTLIIALTQLVNAPKSVVCE